MSKLTSCKTCSKEVAKAAKACPHCGATLRMGFMKRIFLTGTVGFGLLVVLTAVGAGNKEGATKSTSAGNDASVSMSAKAAVEKEVMQISINDILADYHGNEVGADNKYKDKWIQVTGKVGDIKKDIMGSLYVTLGTGKQFEIPQIQAFFADDSNKDLAQLRKGQDLTVVCKVEGLMMNVLSKKCSIK